MNKINRRFSKTYVSMVIVATLGSLFISWPLNAQGLASGYKTKDTGLKPGMAVSLSNESTPDNALVERATTENISKLIGVASEQEENLVTISSGEQQVYVLSSGEVTAFVSDINGEVKKGDDLTLSPLKGILAKADETTATMGSALEDMPLDKAETQSIKTDTGDKTVRIVRMSINIGSNAATRPATDQNNSALARLGQLIVGKKVGDLQVVIALIIFLVVLVTEGSIIYGAVSSGITSIGRNPMAKGIIKKELFKVLFVALFVLFVGLAAVEAILRI
jgi:hypothetical protein